MPLPKVLQAAALLLITACTDFPDLDGTTSREALRAPYPVLVPAEDITSRVASGQITPETVASLEARADRLRARASALSDGVVDSETKTRMQSGLTE